MGYTINSRGKVWGTLSTAEARYGVHYQQQRQGVGYTINSRGKVWGTLSTAEARYGVHYQQQRQGMGYTINSRGKVWGTLSTEARYGVHYQQQRQGMGYTINSRGKVWGTLSTEARYGVHYQQLISTYSAQRNQLWLLTCASPIMAKCECHGHNTCDHEPSVLCPSFPIHFGHHIREKDACLP